MIQINGERILIFDESTISLREKVKTINGTLAINSLTGFITVPTSVGVNDAAQAVSTGQDGIKQVAYTMFIPVLIEAVKELYHKWFDDSTVNHREIASMKVEINAKDKEIAKLKVKAQKAELENTAIKAYLCNRDPKAAFCK
ncbi:MAG: hypothetical protein PHY93_21425 [Bacteriovorax sp.]|nr:hypothetical protein [Bacteriovorax sp.]